MLTVLAACGTVAERPQPAQSPAAAPTTATAPAVDITAPTSAPPPVMPVETTPQPPADTSAARNAIRVAMLVPLSGPNAAIGKSLLEAAQLALFDQSDDRIVLLPRDTKGTPQGAEAAARAALSEGAQVILGPLFAQSVAVVAPLARARSVPVITFSNDRSVAGGGVYVFGLVPGAQVERVIGVAAKRGLTRLAVLAPDSPYGRTVMGAATDAATRFGGQVVISQSYPPEQADLSGLVRRFTNHETRRMILDEQRKLLMAAGDEVSRQALRRLEGIETLGDAGFDALLLPEGGARLRALAPLFPYYDIDPKKVRFLGTWLWGEQGIGTESALVGGWFATPPPDLARRFNQRFQASYGRQPPRLASLGYDAVALVAALARDTSPQPFRATAFADPSGFAGYNGIFRFSDGVAERGLAVVEVQANNWRVIDPAPTTFQTPVN